jgi:beta-galactosidase/beta-glucuronidase
LALTNTKSNGLESKSAVQDSFEFKTIAQGETVLQFVGLDTFVTVTLNGTKILQAENMHRTFRVDISGTVKEGANELEILFDSAIL